MQARLRLVAWEVMDGLGLALIRAFISTKNKAPRFISVPISRMLGDSPTPLVIN